MGDVLLLIDDGDTGRTWVTLEGKEYPLTGGEAGVIQAGYRALYEKLKESL